jgi:hypothetical protein
MLRTSLALTALMACADGTLPPISPADPRDPRAAETRTAAAGEASPVAPEAPPPASRAGHVHHGGPSPSASAPAGAPSRLP